MQHGHLLLNPGLLLRYSCFLSMHHSSVLYSMDDFYNLDFISCTNSLFSCRVFINHDYLSINLSHVIFKLWVLWKFEHMSKLLPILQVLLLPYSCLFMHRIFFLICYDFLNCTVFIDFCKIAINSYTAHESWSSQHLLGWALEIDVLWKKNCQILAHLYDAT